jgi:mono/diheme cytochrome c family protein
MKISFATVATALGLLFLASEALAEPGTYFGKVEYESNCASCHGLTGKGDGPLSRIYLEEPTDLSTLAKRNGGVFPTQRVYEIIDGRQEVAAHGPRAMPVWGRDYRSEVPDLGNLGIFDFRGTVAHAKIIALVDYLYQLQEK